MDAFGMQTCLSRYHVVHAVQANLYLPIMLNANTNTHNSFQFLKFPIIHIADVQGSALWAAC